MKLMMIMLAACFTSALLAQEHNHETNTQSLPDKIKIMTWNVFMIPKPVNWTYQQERAKIIADKLAESDYDIMFFQETFSQAARKKILRGLAKTHPYTAEPNGRKFGTLQSSGLLIASKYPMQTLDQTVFKNCTNSDCLARKSAILVEVTLPSSKKAHFVNTHMQAWNDPKAIVVRKKQLTDIKALMARNKKEGVPQFLVGDLNVDGLKEEEFRSSLELLGMEASPLEGDIQSTNGFKVPCYKVPGGDSNGEWLDHLWYRPIEGAKVISTKVVKMNGKIKRGYCPLSDHHAVESTINL